MGMFCGATTSLTCTMGLAPAVLMALPDKKIMICNLPVANILDNKPMLNITSFTLCKSPMNPAVIAIIASSLGSVTQAPCIPLTTAPMISTVKVLFGPAMAVDNQLKCMCNWGGVISVTKPNQMTVTCG